jgi:hypothetical protein
MLRAITLEGFCRLLKLAEEKDRYTVQKAEKAAKEKNEHS